MKMNTQKTVNGLEITDAIIFPLRKKIPGSHVLAFARVIFNDQFIVNGIRIIQGKNGNFLSYPGELDEKSGKTHDICFPITAEVRGYISDTVLEQYDLVCNHAPGYKTSN